MDSFVICEGRFGAKEPVWELNGANASDYYADEDSDPRSCWVLSLRTAIERELGLASSVKTTMNNPSSLG
ncbi:unnamed protein product [Cochlearia groenlandica]